MESFAINWRDLSGQHSWKDMLEPLNIDLRRYIIHYGEMAQATYDAFVSEKSSELAGRSRYAERDFFFNVGLESGNPFNYSVTKFLYATSEIDFPEAFISNSLSREGERKETNWIGYVAVATDAGKALLGRRDIVIAWRGTVQLSEWYEDIQANDVYAPKIFGDNADAKVHEGFYSVYTSENPHSTCDKTSARDQVMNEIRRLVDEYRDEEISITVTGHSLGAALATLNAVDIAANWFNMPEGEPHKACPVTAIVFASPRVGNFDFQDAFSGYNGLRLLRIRNALDIVPWFPLNGYSHVGEELQIDTRESEYLKLDSPLDFAVSHYLEVYLHGVAGTQGRKGGFKLMVKRDIALLSKTVDNLKDEHKDALAWRIEKNMSLSQHGDMVHWRWLILRRLIFYSRILNSNM
ncbi:hypothetical protein L6164_036809 [Bauhinia variegata]|uniref:Uncharacterized protein n=1 Tax=Bauhinia variegata TaxID=167791 RepID=A0ACB9KI91_BAUVA|nr:hypothetical protein L6164_036809 [Bauhinia variegata]